jgi:hypothetical protein
MVATPVPICDQMRGIHPLCRIPAPLVPRKSRIDPMSRVAERLGILASSIAGYDIAAESTEQRLMPPYFRGVRA